MSQALSVDQVLALAPDASAAQNAREFANPARWLSLAASGEAAWGEIRGSGGTPYRSVAHLPTLAYRCTCPSRKQPCKHSLGLMLIAAGQPDALRSRPAPDWVTEWLAAHARRAANSAKKPPAGAPVEPTPEVSAQPGPQRKPTKREAKVDAGVALLRAWLQDLLAQGLAGAQSRPPAFWESAARRLMDAQAPGLARRVRRLGDTSFSGPGWQERLVEQVGLLALMVEAYPRLDTLPAETQADIRAQVGFTQSQDELLAQPGVSDRWLVLGQSYELDEQLITQRTWLLGAESHRPALVLSFGTRFQPLDASLPPGMALPGELVFFPGSVPLRALVKRRAGALAPVERFPGHADFSAALAVYGRALARNPWVSPYPLAVREILPLRDAHSGERGVDGQGGWLLADSAGKLLPLARAFAHPWRLLAVSGGKPVALFGEWDGSAFLPLSAWAGERFITLSAPLPGKVSHAH